MIDGNSRRTLVAASACLVAAGAWAGRPLNTETADVVDAGVVQLEGYASRVTASGAPTARGWNLQLSGGVGYRTQLAIAASHAHADGMSAAALLLGGKTWLIELGDDSPGVALAYGLTQARPGGDSWRQDTRYLTAVGTQPFGKLLVHANLGWTRSALARQTTTSWALATEYAAADKLSLAAETFGDDHGKPVVSVGALWQAARRISINSSYGVTFDHPRVRQWTLGFLLDL